MAPAMLSYNVFSVLLFALLGDRGEKVSVWHSLLSLRSNPLILATCFGLLLMVLPLGLPGFLLDFTQILGQTAGTMGLICIGGSLAFVSFSGKQWEPLIAVAMKVGLLPVVAWLLAKGFHFDFESTRLLVFFAATPTAVASAIVAKQMGGDEALSSSIVALSTLLSMIPLAILIVVYF